jgi:hypothetical protein
VFERALALDKSYALAYAGLGEVYWNKYDSTKDRTWLDKSRGIAKKQIDWTADLHQRMSAWES